MCRTEERGGETIFVAVKAPLLNVVVSRHAVRQLVADDVSVSKTWS